MKKLAHLFSLAALATAGVLRARLEMPGGFLALPFKLLAGALSPFLAIAGALGFSLGLLTRSPLALVAGGLGTSGLLSYVLSITEPNPGFATAFGLEWRSRIPTELRARLLVRRWNWRLPTVAEPRRESNRVFWRLPNSGRELLCDLWLPPANVPQTGLAFIYLHGSDWYLLDKDTGTRPYFRHLAAQGHVIMDVAYRLFPETDIEGMVADARRAVAWMKANAARYSVNPERIVLGGASAGGHLALLAAYAPAHPAWSPEDLAGRDTAVRGVASFYGPVDLPLTYVHTNQHVTTRDLQPVDEPGAFYLPDDQVEALRSLMGERVERLGFNKRSQAGAFFYLLGGHPEQVPERYARLSPITHVRRDSPPTLLVQGEDDLISPVTAAMGLARKLGQLGVPVVNEVLPQTDHGFDLALPQVSPPAQAGLYDLERFLALLI